MKKLLIIALLIGSSLFAQRPNHDRIKALKTAFITEKLDLSAAEAEKFWPVYNVFEGQMEALRKTSRREFLSKVREESLENLSDDEANAIIDRIMVMKSRELEYRKELIKNLRPILSPKKILKLERAEENFKRKLLERLKNRRKQ